MKNRLLVAGLALVVVFLVPSLRAEDPKPPTPFNLPCNTEADESDPHISSSGSFLFYSCDARGKYDILLSIRRSTRQPWPQGKPLDDYVQTKVDDRSAFATPDGRYPQYLFFATKKDKDINNFDIYAAVRQGPSSTFAAPTPINTIATRDDELHPWLSIDGRHLFFSRKTKDGWRVFHTSRQATTGAAGFGEPAMIDELPAGFHHPTLMPDNKTMFLQGPLEKDRWGLFVSTKTPTGWSKPEPLIINSPDAPTGDMAPCLSRDGRALYFASDRPGGKGKMDLWAIAVADLKKK